MTRHDYKNRPEPCYDEAGRFVPSGPRGVEKHPEDWDRIDQIASLRAMASNPINATTMITREEPLVQVSMMGSHLSVLGDPKIIRHVFVEAADNLAMHPIRQAILKPVLQEGLISAEGKVWKRARHLLAPVFTPRHTHNFAPSMAKSAQQILPTLFDGKQSVLLSDEMLKLAYGILSDTLFSGEIEEDSAAVLADIAALLGHMGRPNILDMIGAPKWIPRINQIIGMAPVRRVRKRVADAAARRKATKMRGEDLPDDFLTLLLSAGDDEQAPLSLAEIEDQVITFIGAGHETTSRAMSWMFYLLSNDTEARDRLHAEVDKLDITTPPKEWISQLPWTMACFEETMRLYPPAALISRRFIAEDHWDGHVFPRGGDVMINLWALHRHKTLWEHPDAFDPSRFFADARAKIDRFAYLPFGLGPRVCIGQRFAMQEAAIMIALTARRYQFDYAGEAPPWPIMRVTIQADNHMPMTVTARGVA